MMVFPGDSMKNKFVLSALAVICLGALGGCASPVTKPTASTSPTATNGNSANNGQASVAAVQAPIEQDLGPTPDVPRSVYFGFDKYDVQNKYRPVIEANAKYLVAHPAARVALQGNTDARGSREYNLALGQKRADSVMSALQLLGAQATQMEAVSFGKEKPKALGTSQADYAENRRVDLAYRQ